MPVPDGEDRQAEHPLSHGAGDSGRGVGVLQAKPRIQCLPDLVGTGLTFRPLAGPQRLQGRPARPPLQADVDEIRRQDAQQDLGQTPTDPERVGIPHTAGSVETATKSRTQRRRSFTSSVVGLVDDMAWLSTPTTISPVQLPQHLVGRDEEGVLLEDAPDNDHRVGPHDVHDYFGTEPGQIVSSAHGVVVLGQDVIEPGFVLHDVLNAGPVLQRPLHVRHQPGQREALSLACL